MEIFSIRDIERLSGIKAHTLRMWEVRYGLVIPHRKESKHRFYTNGDLRHILRIAWLYHQGYKISHIGSLTETAIARLIEKEINSGAFFEEQINDLLSASTQMDEVLMERTIHNSVMQLGVERTMVHVVYPYFEKLGMMWMNETLRPSQEHFSSQFIRSMLIREIDMLPHPYLKSNGSIVLFTPELEYHEIPLLFVQYLLRKNGYATTYLGQNVKGDVVESYCKKKPVSQLHYHHLTNFTHLGADEYVDILSHNFPTKKIVVSGPVAGKIDTPPPNVWLLCSMQDLLNYCRNPYAGPETLPKQRT